MSSSISYLNTFKHISHILLSFSYTNIVFVYSSHTINCFKSTFTMTNMRLYTIYTMFNYLNFIVGVSGKKF